ncbi:MAG: choloylglycine hydrolase [bacterium]|nr:choloylglycine hydrolase [bacterium]
MCTAATYKTKDFYFGRTLDYEYSYKEEVTITPRNYEFKFRNVNNLTSHYAIIGMAFISDNYPLYYDAVNEKGLAIAGLNFVGNAYYNERQLNKENIAQFELIPYLLGSCSSVKEVKKLLEKINITNEPFSEELPLAQLHWIISDKEDCITLESVKEGLKIYDNPVGVLTNNPTFDKQLFNLNNYSGLSPKNKENTFNNKLNFDTYSRGLGALGLPGDLSSMSRFVRVAFVKMNSLSEENEIASVSQFFHILNSVDQQRGCCDLGNNKFEITIYTSCCNTDKGIYYYTTYNNHQITAVDMHKEDLNSSTLIHYPLITREQIRFQN